MKQCSELTCILGTGSRPLTPHAESTAREHAGGLLLHSLEGHVVSSLDLSVCILAPAS